MPPKDYEWPKEREWPCIDTESGEHNVICPKCASANIALVDENGREIWDLDEDGQWIDRGEDYEEPEEKLIRCNDCGHSDPISKRLGFNDSSGAVVVE